MSVCSLEGCGRGPVRGWGLCNSHYRRRYVHGDDFDRSPIRVIPEKCTLPDCGRDHYYSDLCVAHYARRAKHGEDFDRSPVKVPVRGCSQPACERPHAGRGLCNKHLQHLRRGEANPAVKRQHRGPLEARLFDRIDASGICWEWIAGLSTRGYGVMRWDGKNRYVHRLVWEYLAGPIPEGLELDHLCQNHRCCNPDHLEPVTHAENLRRGASHWKGQYANA